MSTFLHDNSMLQTSLNDISDVIWMFCQCLKHTQKTERG